MHGLEGRVAVVTGAARGLGQAIAVRLSAEGARVAVTDIDEAGVAATVGLLPTPGWGCRLDVTDAASIDGALAGATDALGEIDVLVSNAGWERMEPFLVATDETSDRIIDVNLRGPIRCAKAVLSGMIERGWGRIVVISSDAARVGSSGEAVYSAAKAGLLGFTKTLARETAKQGVTVNAVAPGPIDTAILDDAAERYPKIVGGLQRAIPMGRIGQPDDIVGAVAFFASDDAAYITGQTLSVSGGLTML